MPQVRERIRPGEVASFDIDVSQYSTKQIAKAVFGTLSEDQLSVFRDMVREEVFPPVCPVA